MPREWRWICLEDADALTSENATQAELGHVGADLLACLESGDGFALDRVGLHDHLEARERVGDDDVDGGDDGGGDEVGGGAAEVASRAELLLHPLLQPGLADEPE